MKKNILIIVCSCLAAISYAQPQIINSNQIEARYGINEITTDLQGWDLKRNDFNHNLFLTTIALSPTSYSQANNDFVEEFGINKFFYEFSGAKVEVSGNSAGPNLYYISYFDITSANLSVNNIRVGDSLNTVFNAFTKYFLEPNQIIVYHGVNAITYYHNNSVVTRITYETPLY